MMMPIGEYFSKTEEKKADKGINTGLILVEKIRNQFKSNIPIIIITARIDLDKELLHRYNVNHVLNKPIRSTAIIEVIDNLFLRK